MEPYNIWPFVSGLLHLPCFKIFINLFIFGRAGSSLLRVGFLQSQ